jgi:hypothetical protein
MSKLILSLTLLLLSGTLTAFADGVPPPGSPDPNNVGPPSGAILDLAGTPIPSTYTMYSADFTAALSSTDITFAFRNDPGYTAMDDVTVTDLTTHTAASVVNGGFEDGNLTGWTYDNVYGATYGGGVSNGCQGMPNYAGSYVWCDGATQAYDAIDQLIATNIGDMYQISFYLDSVDDTGTYPPSGNFQQVSTNGCVSTSDTSCGSGIDGDGLDVLVYAEGTIPPAATPEPGTLVTMGTGLLALAGMLRRRLPHRI